MAAFSRRHKVWLSIAAVIVPLAVAIPWGLNRSRVSFLFDIRSVPWSVSSVECEHPFIATDTLMTCAFHIDPRDFPRLLEGEHYVEDAPGYGHVHDFASYRALGPNFVPKYHYLAKPKDSPHGGSLDIFANSDKSLVLADLYIE